MLNNAGLVITEVNHLVWICQTPRKRHTRICATVKNGVYVPSVCVSTNVKRVKPEGLKYPSQFLQLFFIHLLCLFITSEQWSGPSHSYNTPIFPSSDTGMNPGNEEATACRGRTTWQEVTASDGEYKEEVAKVWLNKLLFIWLMNLLIVFLFAAGGSTGTSAVSHFISVWWAIPGLKSERFKNKLTSWLGLSFMHELWNLHSWIIKSLGRSKLCRLLPSVLLISISTVQSNNCER